MKNEKRLGLDTTEVALRDDFGEIAQVFDYQNQTAKALSNDIEIVWFSESEVLKCGS